MVRNKTESETGAPDPLSKDSGARGVAPTSFDKSLGGRSEIEEFRKFLQELDTKEKHDALLIFAKAWKFIKGIGANPKALSENPPLFYKAYKNGIIFVWPSGMTFEICIRLSREDELEIRNYFDHLARTEVIQE